MNFQGLAERFPSYVVPKQPEKAIIPYAYHHYWQLAWIQCQPVVYDSVQYPTPEISSFFESLFKSEFERKGWVQPPVGTKPKRIYIDTLPVSYIGYSRDDQNRQLYRDEMLIYHGWTYFGPCIKKYVSSNLIT
jgi:hypothetical protein